MARAAQSNAVGRHSRQLQRWRLEGELAQLLQRTVPKPLQFAAIAHMCDIGDGQGVAIHARHRTVKTMLSAVAAQAHMRDIGEGQDVLVHALRVIDGKDGLVQHLRQGGGMGSWADER